MHVKIANRRRWGKRSRHSWCMRNPQYYISGKRSMPVRKLESVFTCLLIISSISLTISVMGEPSNIPAEMKWYITDTWNLHQKKKKIQSSAVITLSNIVRFYINNYRNWGGISIRCWIHKRNPLLSPDGRAMRCLLWIFVRKLRSNGTAYHNFTPFDEASPKCSE